MAISSQAVTVDIQAPSAQKGGISIRFKNIFIIITYITIFLDICSFHIHHNIEKFIEKITWNTQKIAKYCRIVPLYKKFSQKNITDNTSQKTANSKDTLNVNIIIYLYKKSWRSFNFSICHLLFNSEMIGNNNHIRGAKNNITIHNKLI